MSSLKDKVVVITGGTSGMGEATTELALKEGAKVVIGSRNQNKLAKMAQANNANNFAYQVTDVTKPKEVAALVNLAKEKFGKVDVMYNNAGIMPQGNLSEGKTASWKAMVDTNILGVLNGIAAALPIMKQQKQGLIMATDSVAGHVLYPGSAVYNGTKFAVRAIMEGLRQEEHQNGIKTALVSPGAVATNLLSTVGDEKIKQKYLEADKAKNGALLSKDVAELAVFIMQQPPRVDINEILVRPTGQDV